MFLKSLDLLPIGRDEQESTKKIFPRACLASGFHPLEKIYTNDKFLIGFVESESGHLQTMMNFRFTTSTSEEQAVDLVRGIAAFCQLKGIAIKRYLRIKQ
jgi:hypothetical protein